MYGAKGPGGRGVYARRRLLAVVVVLLLLALLAPRACQALLGSNEDAGQGEGQKSGVAGKAAGAGAEDDAADADTSNADTGNAGAEKSDTQDKPGTQDDSSDRGAPFVDEGPGSEDSSGEASEEAAPDLGVMVTNLAVIDGSEDFAASEDQGAGGTAPGSSETASEQPISELQFALAASPAPAQQPSSEPEPAPTRRSEPAAAAPVAEPAPPPLGERIRDRAGRRASAALAAPAALDEVAARQTVVEPVAVEPVPIAPVAVEPVAPAPPATVASGPAFTPTPAGGALNGTPAMPAARATLPAGPRLARVGPGRTPGPAIF
jgi:ribonuclease E